MRIVYINGNFISEDRAKLSIFDRAVLFGDSIYEVVAVVGGKFIDYSGHMARLKRSLLEMSITSPTSEGGFLTIMRQVVSRNGLDEGILYIQVTRGAADRDFRIDQQGMTPSVIMFTQAFPVVANPMLATGARVVTAPDLRWGRRDIKTTQLLYPSMAFSEARLSGADDVWFVEDGYVTEAAAKTAHIITQQGELITRDLSHAILPGVTRAVLLELVREAELAVVERPFTVKEARGASEAFMTSCGQFITPVVSIDGLPVGSGQVGALTNRMSQLYVAHALATAV